jgi:hypothetical protein
VAVSYSIPEMGESSQKWNKSKSSHYWLALTWLEQRFDGLKTWLLTGIVVLFMTCGWAWLDSDRKRFNLTCKLLKTASQARCLSPTIMYMRFSHTGFIFRQHISKMSWKTLQMLTMLKCNYGLMQKSFSINWCRIKLIFFKAISSVRLDWKKTVDSRFDWDLPWVENDSFELMT